ncbi:MAG: DsbA family protein [Solirubrobacterales bacterium]
MGAEPDRRQRLLQLGAGAVFLAVVAVAVLIVVASSGGSGGDTKIEEAAEVNTLLAGIPQGGTLLGDPGAPVELIEFGDLQCPVCKGYSEEILPPIIESQVKHGQVKIDFRNLAIIGEQSTPAGAAALAAGEQGRGWSYIELFYRNQGEEDSGYADGAFLEAIARSAGVKNLAKWNRDRQVLTPEVEKTTEEGHSLGYEGTPSFAIEGPNTEGLRLLDTPESTGALEEAIEDAS